MQYLRPLLHPVQPATRGGGGRSRKEGSGDGDSSNRKALFWRQRWPPADSPDVDSIQYHVGFELHYLDRFNKSMHMLRTHEYPRHAECSSVIHSSQGNLYTISRSPHQRGADLDGAPGVRPEAAKAGGI